MTDDALYGGLWLRTALCDDSIVDHSPGCRVICPICTMLLGFEVHTCRNNRMFSNGRDVGSDLSSSLPN